MMRRSTIAGLYSLTIYLTWHLYFNMDASEWLQGLIICSWLGFTVAAIVLSRVEKRTKGSPGWLGFWLATGTLLVFIGVLSFCAFLSESRIERQYHSNTVGRVTITP